MTVLLFIILALFVLAIILARRVLIQEYRIMELNDENLNLKAVIRIQESIIE